MYKQLQSAGEPKLELTCREENLAQSVKNLTLKNLSQLDKFDPSK